MSDTEKEVFRQIAIDLINEYRQQRGLSPINFFPIDTTVASAFIRSIQLHEKTKKELAEVKQELADFRQEVSFTVVSLCNTEFAGHSHRRVREMLSRRFIIPTVEPDPLFDVMWDLGMADNRRGVEFMAARINDALTARGLEIREKNDD